MERVREFCEFAGEAELHRYGEKDLVGRAAASDVWHAGIPDVRRDDESGRSVRHRRSDAGHRGEAAQTVHEEPELANDYSKLLELVGDETVMFASDWPHHDFDHPRKLRSFHLSETRKRKIFSENALAFFDRMRE